MIVKTLSLIPLRAFFVCSIVMIIFAISGGFIFPQFGAYHIVRSDECSSIMNCKSGQTFFFLNIAVQILLLFHIWKIPVSEIINHAYWFDGQRNMYRGLIRLGDRNLFFVRLFSFLIFSSVLLFLQILMIYSVPENWPTYFSLSEVKMLNRMWVLTTAFTMLLALWINDRSPISSIAIVTTVFMLTLFVTNKSNTIVLSVVFFFLLTHIYRHFIGATFRLLFYMTISVSCIASIYFQINSIDTKTPMSRNHDALQFRPSLPGTLSAWMGATESLKEHPTAIIVVAGGGGYRASIWTALVLDRLAILDKQGIIPGFMNNIRLITGASGGMVAAAYYSALLRPGDQGIPGESISSKIIEDVTGVIPSADYSNVQIDSMRDIIRTFILIDAWSWLLPYSIEWNRGAALETQWQTLEVPFLSLSNGEIEGWRPPIVLSPTISERSAPGYFTNLFIPSTIDTANDKSSDMLGVDLFGLLTFVDQIDRNTLTVARAVRINATYPFVSPNFEVFSTYNIRNGFSDVRQKINLIDAGYHDNSGLFAAKEFLNNSDVLRTLSGTIKNLLIIRINGAPEYPSGVIMRPAGDGCYMIPYYPLPLSNGSILDVIKVPLSTWASVQESKILDFYNQQIKEIRAFYEEGGINVQVLEIGNGGNISMSWHQSEDDLQCQLKILELAFSRERLSDIVRIWDNKK